ncbi:MAG: hypothetical protein CM1200mP40_28510 [Gammaproteobacteria bacterium]|nr:MAG: hypothetical protein CM1200mP40_28510 [Gammaproteobacteria bacterium]
MLILERSGLSYLNRFNEAKDSYEIILNQHEDSAKFPDAMYGLA